MKSLRKNKKDMGKRIEKKIDKKIFEKIVRDQMLTAADKLDFETKEALRDVKEKTTEKIFEIQSTVMPDEDKYRLIKEFVYSTIDENEFLKDRLEDNILNQRKDSTELARSVASRAREALEKVTIQGWVEYYWNWDMKAYKLIPLTIVNTVWFSEDTQEVFLLDTPAKLLRGKPVFMVLRGIPFAMPMDFRVQDLANSLNGMYKIDKRFVFGRNHLSSWDLYSKLNSLIIDRIFKPNKLTLKSVFGYVVSFLFGLLVMWSFVSPYLIAAPTPEGG